MLRTLKMLKHGISMRESVLRRDKVLKLVPTYAYVHAVAPEVSDVTDVAFGKALDIAIAQYNYYHYRNHELLLNEALRCAMDIFIHELSRNGVRLSKDDIEYYSRKFMKMLQCWASSPYVKYLRPRTHVIIFEMDNEYRGVFAQPDFYDPFSNVFYELKSFDIEKEPKKHVEVQARVFSLLGSLKLIYFSSTGNEYVIKERSVKSDEAVINELWEFIGSYMGAEVEPLDKVVLSYPTVHYVYDRSRKCWRRTF